MPVLNSLDTAGVAEAWRNGEKNMGQNVIRGRAMSKKKNQEKDGKKERKHRDNQKVDRYKETIVVLTSHETNGLHFS